LTNLRIVFLGTSGGMPSQRRSLPSIALRYGASLLLLDCGEGTQRQMVSAGVGFKEDFQVFISHLHGDHILGLPGLFYSMSMLGREEKVRVHGPPGLARSLDLMLESCQGAVSFPIEVHEVRGGETACERGRYSVKTAWADHLVETLAYCFEEKPRQGRMLVDKLKEMGVPQGPLWGELQRGRNVNIQGRVIDPREVTGARRRGRKIVYSGDTRPCKDVVKLAGAADVLIHDSSFDQSLTDRAALEGHSTSVQAAQVAKEASVGRLFLFHLSPRYHDEINLLLGPARAIFPASEVPEDLASLELPIKEAPVLET